MSANYNLSKSYLRPIEGGYARPNGRKAGETYRGIDRNYQAGWQGWPLIDRWKAKHGTPKTGAIINDPAIEAWVVDFYGKFWNQMGLQHLTNPILAAKLFAFVVHRQYAAITVINRVAKSLGATNINTLTITPNVAQVFESRVSSAYQLMRSAIIAHYNSLQDPNKASYIKNRVDIFPKSIAQKKSFWQRVSDFLP